MRRGPQLPGGPIYLIDRCSGVPALLLPALAHVTWRLPVSRGPSFLASASRVAFPPSRQQLESLHLRHRGCLCKTRITHRSKVVTVTFHSDLNPSIPCHSQNPAAYTIAKMTQTEEDYDEAQAGDESMTGPGAPTPVAALEASLHARCTFTGPYF